MVDLEYLNTLEWDWGNFKPIHLKRVEKGSDYFINSLNFPPLDDLLGQESIYLADALRFIIYTKTEILDYSDKWLYNLNFRLRNRYDGYMVKIKEKEFAIAFYDENLLLHIDDLKIKRDYNISAVKNNIFVTGLVKITSESGRNYIRTAFFLGENNDGSDFKLSNNLELDRIYNRGKFMLLYNAFNNFAINYIDNYQDEIDPEIILKNLHQENVETGKGVLKAIGYAIIIFFSIILGIPLIFLLLYQLK